MLPQTVAASSASRSLSAVSNLENSKKKMEDNTIGLFQEEFGKNETSAEELLRQYILANNYSMEDIEDFQSLKLKTSEEMLMEREKLKNQLDELRRENFAIRASVNAWQLTLKKKLDEFKEADLKLNEIYDEIWIEREHFCSRADEFNEEFGILSEWWEKQMKFVSELEYLEKKTLDDKKCREEIDRLEKEFNELEKEIEKSQEEKNKHVVEVDVHVAVGGGALRHTEPKEEVLFQEQEKKSSNLSEIDGQIEVCEEKVRSLKNDFFSMVDVNTVRVASRKQRSSKNSFLAGVKKFLKQ